MREHVVIITGGGTGIGRAAALQFARRGARVAIVGRRADQLEETARLSDQIMPVVADIQSGPDVAVVAREALARWGRIDVLVNNAGAFVQGSLQQVEREPLISLLATNILGPTFMSQAVLPYLRASRGCIINISSTFGHKASPMISHYAASKAALEHLTRCWALELAPEHIRVNAIAPGPVETQILERAGLSASEVEQIRRDEAGRIPLNRHGSAEEVAAWIVAMADPAAAWMTGQVLAVDGGLSVA